MMSMMFETPIAPAASVPTPTIHTRRRMPSSEALDLRVLLLEVEVAERAAVVGRHLVPRAQQLEDSLLDDGSG
jgi:hypothetical protein